MRKVLILLLVVTTFNITAQVASNDQIVFTIRYQNKQVYYPQSQIVLRASIKNTGSDDYLFELADDPFFNVDISVRTLTNLALNSSDLYIRRTQSNQSRPALYRLMSLKSGEEHSFEIVLGDYVAIKEPSTYIIQAEFRPKARLNIEHRLVSTNSLNYASLKANHLGLTVRPFVASRTFQDMVDLETNEIIKQEALSPDNVVSYMLDARQKEHWNKFFLYINLEQLYLNNIDRSRRYSYADKQVKAQMIEEFREKLMSNEVDSDLSTIPRQFNILKTSYTADTAEVVTRQLYRQRQYDEIKEYRWFLRRDVDRGIWLIYDYMVTNLGSER